MQDQRSTARRHASWRLKVSVIIGMLALGYVGRSYFRLEKRKLGHDALKGSERPSMASLSELRDALTALGLSTSTGAARGDERRAILQCRLQEAQLKLGVASHETLSRVEKNAARESQKKTSSLQSCGNMTLSDLRAELEARQLPTQTPGLKGEGRRHALIQRLQNSANTICRDIKQPQFSSSSSYESVDETKSSRSSTSSYSTAGEFFFIDMESTRKPDQVPTLALPPTLKALNPQQTQNHQDHQTSTLSDRLRKELERELVDMRKQLHEDRARRSQQTSRRLQDAGFNMTLEDLSTAMKRLENERHRLLRVAFGHEVVRTTILGEKSIELVQEDAIRLIETRQHHLRCQIQNIKEAMRLSTDQELKVEQDLEASIQRVEMQLRLYKATSRTSSDRDDSPRSAAPSASHSAEPGSFDTPLLTRCRSVPHHMFHETWCKLEDPDKQRLHQDLRTVKSFMIRHDRICVGKVPQTKRPDSDSSNARQRVLALFRSPPTPADKLGVKALFMEQTLRSSIEIQGIYKQALTLEPSHALLLGNYARFLYQNCGKIDQAEGAFDQAIRADPLCAANLAAYASFMHHARDALDKAEELYIRALQVDPQNPITLGNYASLLRKTANGRISRILQAKDLLVQAVALDRGLLNNRLRLCAVFEDLGEVRQALWEFEELVNSIDSDAQRSIGLESNQIETTPRTAAVISEYAHIYGNFANFLARQGRMDQAKLMHETALRIRPQNPLLQRNFSLFLRDWKAQTKSIPPRKS